MERRGRGKGRERGGGEKWMHIKKVKWNWMMEETQEVKRKRRMDAKRGDKVDGTRKRKRKRMEEEEEDGCTNKQCKMVKKDG